MVSWSVREVLVERDRSISEWMNERVMTDV